MSTTNPANDNLPKSDPVELFRELSRAPDPGSAASLLIFSGVRNVFQCLSESQIFQVVSNSAASDLTGALQACAKETGAATLVWPPGLYYVASGPIVMAWGQRWVGGGSGTGPSGAVIALGSNNGPGVKMIGANEVNGFSLSGDGAPTSNNQACIWISNSNNNKVYHNFFNNCYYGVYVDGQSFYTDIDDYQGYQQPFGAAIRVYGYEGTTGFATGGAMTAAGVDLMIRHSRFPGVNGLAWSFDGLGSLIASDIQISGNTNCGGPCILFNTAAPEYGGAQITGLVCENNGASTQPCVSLAGTSTHPLGNIDIYDPLIAGNNGVGVQLGFTSSLKIHGGGVSSINRAGAINFGANGSNLDFLFDGVRLDGDAGVSPIQNGAAGGTALSGTLSNVTWGGGAPIVNFTNSGESANLIAYFNVIGGNPGTASTPWLLPSGYIPGDRCAPSYCVRGKIDFVDRHSCTLSKGSCTAPLATRYASAPTCFVTAQSGALTGVLKCSCTTTACTVTDSVSSDAAVIGLFPLGN